jgi:hypothetical protein
MKSFSGGGARGTAAQRMPGSEDQPALSRLQCRRYFEDASPYRAPENHWSDGPPVAFHSMPMAPVPVWQEWSVVISLIALAVSLAVAALNIYTQLIQGPKLSAALSRIVLLRVTDLEKGEILVNMLAADALSESPSEATTRELHPDVFIRLNSGVLTHERLLQFLQRRYRKGQINYRPDKQTIWRWFESHPWHSAFYIPLMVNNSGRKPGHISLLTMVATNSQDQTKRTFSSVVELEPSTIIKLNKEWTDHDRIKGLFSGIAVGPLSNVRVDPLFNRYPVKDKEDSGKPITPGDYIFSVSGYDQRGRRVLTSKPAQLRLTADELAESLMGVDSSKFVTPEAVVSHALGHA